jgi:ABC-type branched-subunit amino acid transport system permease subunit
MTTLSASQEGGRESLLAGAPRCYFALPGYRVLGSQILIAALFCLSLDLILGYAGIVSLGHAAFFGLGAYTAGLLAANGWGEPLSGLAAAAWSRAAWASRRASSSCAGATSRA